MLLSRKFPGLLLMVACGFLMVGCASKPQLKLSGLTSLSRPPLVLDAASLEVLKNQESAGGERQVESLMQPSPIVIIEQWARDRFSPQGSQGRAVLSVDEASVVEQPLKGSAEGFRTPSIKYTANIALKLELFGPGGETRGYAQTVSSASRAVPESLTLAEREKVWLCLTETALNQADLMLEKKIQEYLEGH